MSASNLSYDLIWQVTRKNSSFLVKRPANGGVQYSAEPLNSTGVYNKSSSGFANSHAYGVQASKNGVELLTKENKYFNQPAKAVKVTPFNPKEAAAKKTDDDELEAALQKGYALERALQSSA